MSKNRVLVLTEKIVDLLNTRIADIESALQTCKNECQEKIHSLNSMLAEFKNVLRVCEENKCDVNYVLPQIIHLKKLKETVIENAMRVCVAEHKKYRGDELTQQNMMALGYMSMGIGDLLSWTGYDKDIDEKSDSVKTISKLIKSLIAREHEVPEHGKDFEIIEKRENNTGEFTSRNGEVRLDDFVLQIVPAFNDPENQRRLEAATTDSGGLITTSLKKGTTREVFDFLKSKHVLIKLEHAFRALFKHKLSMD